MNFLDTYDVPGQTTPTQPPQQSLNDEVTEVIGSLGRLWGGFRKQSQTVLQSARKDFSEVVTQAQKELTKLTSEPTQAPTRELSDYGDTPASRAAVADNDTSALPTSTPEETPGASTSTSTSTSLFSRLQSALPPNLLETARNQLPESLKNVSENIDLPQLRANFVTEFQRVQGVTLAQAEEYAHKSEVLLREAVKEAGDVLRDAVKILPPEQADGGLVWDGSDMWSLPLEPSDAASSSNTPPSDPSTAHRRYAEAQEAVATRAESLFRRLRHDPAIVRHDPAVDAGELYSAWVAEEVDSKDGGIGGDHWIAKINTLLAEPSSGEVLKTTKDALVPGELTEAEFWTRFLFRAHQIEAEEQKRKALLEGNLEEEDFSWEDDDEETGTSEVPSTAASFVHASNSSEPSTSNENTLETADDKSQSLLPTPAMGKRESSEDYDVVSSGNVSPRVSSNPVPLSEEANDDSSDADSADSDWE
ncbi:hypothetical protein H0H81_005154 [Sphagnurus paluster]|uniref:BSD domain-containing protein n=1 Tax=Sphagnurus paluster TaxID=117069 RepID=A0A9P7GKP7_9AGAR|nr:hypothetical protein H0H81_005154 [Sphagnurus paluster]